MVPGHQGPGLSSISTHWGTDKPGGSRIWWRGSCCWVSKSLAAWPSLWGGRWGSCSYGAHGQAFLWPHLTGRGAKQLTQGNVSHCHMTCQASVSLMSHGDPTFLPCRSAGGYSVCENLLAQHGSSVNGWLLLFPKDRPQNFPDFVDTCYASPNKGNLNSVPSCGSRLHFSLCQFTAFPSWWWLDPQRWLLIKWSCVFMSIFKIHYSYNLTTTVRHIFHSVDFSWIFIPFQCAKSHINLTWRFKNMYLARCSGVCL